MMILGGSGSGKSTHVKHFLHEELGKKEIYDIFLAIF